MGAECEDRLNICKTRCYVHGSEEEFAINWNFSLELGHSVNVTCFSVVALGTWA